MRQEQENLAERDVHQQFVICCLVYLQVIVERFEQPPERNPPVCPIDEIPEKLAHFRNFAEVRSVEQTYFRQWKAGDVGGLCTRQVGWPGRPDVKLRDGFVVRTLTRATRGQDRCHDVV